MTTRGSVKKSPHGQFTIASLMIATAVAAAGLLAFRSGLGELTFVLSVPCVSMIVARRLFFGRRPRLAGHLFWVAASSTNVLVAFSCLPPDSYLLLAIFLGVVIMAIPTIAVLGTAWAVLLSQHTHLTRRTRDGAGISVFVLTALPIVTLWTLWPLHFAFLAARPALNSVADQIAAGRSVNFPRRVGLFKINAASFDTASGTVGLMIDPNPSGPTGFVRVRSGPMLNAKSPIIGSNLNIDLGGGWSYREAD